MQRARYRIREITDRRWLLRPVDDTVREVNAFLRGWADYFRYGNSAHHFGTISDYAARRVAWHVAKRHKRPRGYGWSVLAFQSPDRLGLIDLNGIVVAPRPHRAWRGE
jgi:RNA-directed DNA polymerase